MSPRETREHAPAGAVREAIIDGYRVVTDDATSERMGRVRQKGTKPEQAVRTILTMLGLRYRLDNRDLPGSPDIANRSRGWVVFVHGCYWHRHKGCRLATTPTRNRDFWVAKFEANVKRDARVRRQLQALGYRVVTVWECQTRDADKVALRLTRLLSGREPA